jgi:S-DNA-T family DNA segregation ATPase FtsK/SpoIIIE
MSITISKALDLASGFLGNSQLPVGVGGDTLSLLSFDTLQDGAGFIVTGPPRTGKSTALSFMLREADERGWRSIVIAPRLSPLRGFTGQRLRGEFHATSSVGDLEEALKSLGPRHVVVFDDFDVLGPDHAISAAVAQHYATLRDSGSAVIVACGIDEVGGYYRGLTADIRKGRTGLLLAPRASTDGEILNIRLPRSATATLPLGRGVFARPGGWTWAQVPIEG